MDFCIGTQKKTFGSGKFYIINIWFFNEKSYLRQTGRLKQYYMG
jgi:hypothetical protein